MTSRSDWTRRTALLSFASLPAFGASAKGQIFPSDRRRFLDAATEFEVIQLTDPSYSSLLPPAYARALSRRGTFLVFACDRGGSMQAFRMDLKTGEQRQLTEAMALDPATLTLTPDARGIYCFDGDSLQRTMLGNLRSREIYRVPEGWRRGNGFSVSDDGLYAFLVEVKDGAFRLRLLPLVRGTPATVIESKTSLETPLPRPRRAGILYRLGGNSLALVNFDGRDDRLLKTAPGRLGPFLWSADGRTALYLNFPEDRRLLNNLRELTPDSNTDRLIAPTSQYVAFSRNGDSSVFVGASANKASPHVLILLRVTRRELTLCEHRASDPAAVAPIFTSDSQRVFFQSDKRGKPALFTMAVDKFVENTGTER